MAKATSVTILVLIIGAAISLLRVPAWHAAAVVGVLIILVMVWTLFAAPLGISSDGYCIAIHHPIGRTVIPRQTIRSVIRIDQSELAGSIRMFGSSGFFGYYGFFHNRRLGMYRMYITRKEDLVLISTYNRNYVVNCSDLDIFEK